MKSRIKTMWLHLFALLFVVSVAHAQSTQAAQAAQPAQSNFSQPELDQMLAPIALYPDALLSQVLMASTYPAEVAEASQWSKANPGYKGEAAVKAAQNQPWDISVKSLLPFPQVLGTMESKPDWTTNLGNAFLGQEQQVMDTIQSLRRKAMQAGYLKSDNRVRVVEDAQLISINLVSPTAVYVPYYNPTVVYGTWWAPNYAPVYWAPWQGYAAAPGYYGWAWAPVATVVAVGVLYGAFNWRSRNMYYGRHVGYWRGYHGYNRYRSGGRWSHNPAHRGNVAYRHTSVNSRYGHAARTTGRATGRTATGRTVTRTTTGRTATGRTATGRTVKRTTTGRTATGRTATGRTATTRTNRTVKRTTTTRSTAGRSPAGARSVKTTRTVTKTVNKPTHKKH